jgi:hypothetical protein
MCPFDEGYRFYPNRYDANVKFSASISRPFRVYVFEGACLYSSETETVSIGAGEFADLPPSRYDFEVGEVPIRLMKVYKLPELAKKQS